MARICVKVCCYIGSIVHMLWAATLIALTAVLHSEKVTRHIGLVPTIYDLGILWLYDVGIFVTGVIIFVALIWKRQRILSWMILLFLLFQSMAFGVVIVMLTTDRFRNSSLANILESAVHLSASFIVTAVTAVHCLGSFIYVILLIVCINKLNEKYSPYWK